MTSHRVLTTLIFFALLLLGLFNPYFYWIPPLIILCTTIWGVLEFSHLHMQRPPRVQLVLSVLGGVALLVDGYFFSLQNVVAIVGFLMVLTIAAGLPLRGIDIAAVAGKSVISPLYVALPFAMILHLWKDNLDPGAPAPNAGAHYLLFLIIITWASDTGAYFAGRWFGRTKLAPKLSPGKTVEGLIGGIIFTLVLAVALKFFWNNIDGLFDWGEVLLLGFLFSIIGPMGDLAESQLKRRAEVKDSGRTFTGMGGMLDIVDSLLFTTIFYYVYLRLFHEQAFPLG